MIDVNKLKASAEATGLDATQTVAGGSYTPPEKGKARARLIGYIEVGKHEHRYGQAEPKQEDDVIFIFELSGKKWPAKEVEGVKVPQRISIEVSKSLNIKSKFIKLFNAMNYEKTAKHPVEFLDKEFLVDIIHDEFEMRNQPGKKGVKATLYNKELGCYTVGAPFMALDPEDPSILTRVPAAERISELKALLWDNPDAAQWASIHIEGKYEDGKSKNTLQEKCLSALNYQGSPLQQLIQGGGAVDKVLEQFQQGEDSSNPLDDLP